MDILRKLSIENNDYKICEITKEDMDYMLLWLKNEELYKYWGQGIKEYEKDSSLFLKHYDAKDMVQYGIREKKTGNVIGQILLYDIVDDRQLTIGYRIAPKHQGKHIASTLVKLVVEEILRNSSIKRIQAMVDVNNVSSSKVLENAGFVKEGTIRDGKMIEVYCTYNIYGILESDLM